MTPLVSIFLDWLRFALALTVAGGHLSRSCFQDGWPNLVRYALVAVGGFFVLSGYTIRFVTRDARDANQIGRYFGDRAARLLSVTLPALALTLVCDAVAWTVAPDFYSRYWGGQTDHAAFRLLANLVLYSQPYGLDIKPLSNNPFWSLSYEAGFYVLWGLFLWASSSRGRYWPLIVAAIFFGPNIVFLMPLWLLGVLLHDQVERLTTPRATWRLLRYASVCCCGVGLLIWLFGADLASGGRAAIQWLFDAIAVPRAHVAFSYIAGGVLLYLGLTLALPLLKILESRFSPSPRLVAWSRTLGEATFPLYLFHFPLLVLTGSLEIIDRSSAPQKLLLLLLIVSVSILAVRPTNRLKAVLRLGFRRALHCYPAVALRKRTHEVAG